MEKIELNMNLETAKIIYLQVPPEIKKQLKEKFGKDNFRLEPMELKTMDDVYEFLDLTQAEIDEIENTTLQDEKNYRRLKKIARALNPPEFIPDYNNSDQKKWAPYFIRDESGFGFSFSFYDLTCTIASLGSLLCFATEELSKHAGKTFTEIYKGFIINNFNKNESNTINAKIIDFKKIKSLEDAINSLPDNDPDVEFYKKIKAISYPDYLLAHIELIIITKAVNPSDFIPDFDDTDQYKWFPWFRGGQSGFGFSYSSYGRAFTCTGFGSLLCLSDEERAEHCGKTFTTIYKRYLIK